LIGGDAEDHYRRVWRDAAKLIHDRQVPAFREGQIEQDGAEAVAMKSSQPIRKAASPLYPQQASGVCEDIPHQLALWLRSFNKENTGNATTIQWVLGSHPL
jgi:hypothetical protein